MNIKRVLALLLVLSLRAVPQTDTARSASKPDDRFKADVLLIVAHPDDETGVSAYLAQLFRHHLSNLDRLCTLSRSLDAIISPSLLDPVFLF